MPRAIRCHPFGVFQMKCARATSGLATILGARAPSYTMSPLRGFSGARAPSYTTSRPRGYALVVDVGDASLAKDRRRTGVYGGKAADHRDRGMSSKNPLIAGAGSSSASSTIRRGLIITRRSHVTGRAGTGGRPTACRIPLAVSPASDRRPRRSCIPRLITRAELSDTSHAQRGNYAIDGRWYLVLGGVRLIVKRLAPDESVEIQE